MDKIKIIDIGAANYEQDERWNFQRHDVETILFEPDERSYLDLKSKGYEAYNFALGSKTGIQSLNLTRKPQCSSFLTPNMELLQRYPEKERWDIVGAVNVNVRDLDSFMLDADFIKLDTQGSELEVLVGAANTLNETLGLEIEVSFIEIYKGQPLFGDVCRYLADAGFELFDFITEYRYGRQELNRKGQLSFADALFLKTPETVSGMSKDKIDKYITIVNAYGKNDLANCLT